MSFIDNEHKNLVAMANDLHQAMRQGQGQAQLGRMLDWLVKYIKSHFNSGEAVMDYHRYPDIRAHRAQHAHLLSSLK